MSEMSRDPPVDAAASQFAPGDIVRLKSGSPRYTVVLAGDTMVRIIWSVYDTRKIETQDVPTIALVKA